MRLLNKCCCKEQKHHGAQPRQSRVMQLSLTTQAATAQSCAGQSVWSGVRQATVVWERTTRSISSVVTPGAMAAWAASSTSLPTLQAALMPSSSGPRQKGTVQRPQRQPEQWEELPHGEQGSLRVCHEAL